MTYLSPEYRAYMHSPEWQEVRRRKFDQVGERCQRCGKWRHQLESPRILQVHHKTYKRLFHEWLSDLEVLCVPCHEIKTRRMRMRRQVMSWFGG